MPKISIICPVYNSEKHLYKCVDSIIAQSFIEWELILVDDGSKDTSSKVCDKYAANDSRIRVIHKTNEGVSAARQTGIDEAQGEYTIHIDSDDWVDPTMLEELYIKAKTEDADMVICDYFNNTLDSETVRIQKPVEVSNNEQTIKDLFSFLHGATWNKLIRRSCYTKFSIRFPEGLNYCEDQLTIVRLLLNPIKVSYLNKAFYHYCDNSNSITRNYKRPQYEARIYFLELLEKYLPYELKIVIVNKVNFNIFIEAIIYKVLTKDEKEKGIRKYKDEISSLCLRWRIGFLCLKCGFDSLAYKFLKY